MRKPSSFSVFSVLTAALLLMFRPPARAADFITEVEAASAKHAADSKKASELAFSGNVAGGNKWLLSVVKRDPSPALEFVVANLLYKMDPEASYALHQKVYEAKPDEPNVSLEWALERHRRGEYAEAVPLYGKFLAANPGDRYSALLAECLIRQGKLKEGVEAWEAARHPQQHTAIDFAICDVHGDLAPLRRRSDLLERLGKGETQVADKLIDQDLNMDDDWWNSQVCKGCLDHDLPLVEKALGRESGRYQEIRCWVNIASLPEPQPEAIVKELKRSGLIVEAGKLPTDSFVAGKLIGIVQENEIEKADPLFERFGKELLVRAKSPEGDAEALNILCGLSTGDKVLDRLAEYDRYGMERYGEFRFVGSLLAGLGDQGKLTTDSRELKMALEKFPESGIVRQVAIRCTAEEKVTKEMLVAAIEAEFHKLSMGREGMVDSYTLKSYFALLKAKL